MIRLVFFIVMLFIAVFSAGGLVYMIFRFLSNLNPGRKKISEDIDAMRTEIEQWYKDLVPWDAEEMKLLSFSQINQSISKRFGKTAKGIFTSIYHEPLFAYAYKKYFASSKTSILYARTSHHEYVYKINNKQTTILIDNQKVGVLDENGALRGGKNNRLLARINRSNELYSPVMVNNREVASLVNPSLSGRETPRALEFVHDMAPKEEAVFLSLAIHELVMREIV